MTEAASQIAAKMAEMAARFAHRAGEFRAELADATTRDDRTALAAVAHRLAGIAPMFGQAAIGEVALELEEAAETGGEYAALASQLDRLLLELANA